MIGYLRPDQFLDHLIIIGVSNFQQIKTKEKFFQVNLESLGNALHKKDYYGKEAISEPQVWSKTFSDPMVCLFKNTYSFPKHFMHRCEPHSEKKELFWKQRQ